MAYPSNDLRYDRYHIVNLKSRQAFKLGFPLYSGLGCSLDKCFYFNMNCVYCNFCNYSSL